jgi:cytochrome P450
VSQVAIHFDPFSYEHHDDPYPTYKLLRDHAPAFFNTEHEFWTLSRDEDVRGAVHDWETYSSAGGITIEHTGEATAGQFIEMDPPRHTQMRSLVSRAFTPRRIAALEDPCRDLARTLIDGFASTGRCDLIADFSALLPMAVISWMLGVPDADQDMLRGWSDAMLHREPGDPSVTPAGMEGATNLFGYFGRLVEERRASPHDDLVSVLIAAEEDGQRLSAQELLAFCFLLIVAGNETTTKLIGNAMYWLEQHPEQRATVRADRALVPGAVEETLRFDGSTQAMARTLTRDVELHGETMDAGRKVLLLFGAANRDERRWGADVDTFDVRRDASGHLGLGHGIHHCLGAAVARLEARVALEELLPRLGDYRIDADGLERVHSGNVRGYSRMPLEFAQD